MYFRFCKSSILKWQCEIYRFSCSVASNLSVVLGPNPSFLQGISCLQTSFLMVELFWWLPSSTFLLLQVSPILPFLDLRLVGKGFLTEKVLDDMKYCILLICQKFWNPVLFSSRLLQNVLIYLLIAHLQYFLTRIIFLSMVNLSWFPPDWLSWI